VNKIKETINGLRLFWSNQPKSKKIQLIAVIFFVLVIPLTVGGALTIQSIRSRASYPATPPITPPLTPTPTAISTSTPIPCSQGFADSFDSINTNRWQKCGDGVSISSGVLVIKRDEAGTSSTCATSDSISTKESLSGDFVVEMDIPEVYKSGDGGGAAAIVFSADNTGTTGLNIVRGRKNKNQNKTFYISTTLSSGGNSDTSGQVNLASGPVSVKVERKTGVFSVYYKAGNGSYTLLKRFQNTLTTPIKNIYLSAINTEYTPAEYTTVKYDNFKISCINVSTTTPTATATATSTRTASPSPTAISSSTPTPRPTIKPTSTATAIPNIKPVITTRLLPVGRINRNYSVTIVGYDLNTNNSLAMNTSGLPTSFGFKGCTTTIEQNRKVVRCTYTGIARKAGVFGIRTTLDDYAGGVAIKNYYLLILPY
jgi:hypothetical protein